VEAPTARRENSAAALRELGRLRRPGRGPADAAGACLEGMV